MASFSDLITHTRASTATYVDSSGILQTAASGVPRVGHHIYDGSAWVNEGILHESEARTNVLLDSGDPTTANWVRDPDITLANDAVGLDGVSGNAYTITESNSTGVGSVKQNITVSADSNTHTGFSFIGKDNDETRYPELNLVLPGVAGESATLNTKTGVITARRQSGGTTEVVDFGNFWKIVQTIANDGTGTTLRFQVTPALNTDGTGSPELSATGSIVYAGGQVELNTSTPSSYIPTAGSQVTRAADSMTIPAAKLPYDATNMSIAMEGRITYADTDSGSEIVQYQWLRTGTDFIRASISTTGSRTGQQQFWQREATSGQDIVSSGNTYYAPGINVPLSIAARHGSTFINGAVDGTALTANTTPTALPDLSATDLELGDKFMGTIRLFRMWNDDLGDSGIEEASA